ncbi:MAG TPA: IS481 family transposase [Candidatus Baltobacteraceae bacterium]|nr:IS481 family transposase [Candidatus Baltobacteraceae bacterium]
MAHPNARLTAHGRALLVDRIRAGWTITAAARAAGVSRQTGSKWWHRARTGVLTDRTSAVHHQARAYPPELVARLCARRRELRVGPHVLAWEAGLARSTVYAWLRRAGLGRLDRLEPRPPVVRYERERPGELVHLDTKQLGRIRPGGGLPKPRREAGYGAGRKRGIGWDRVHVAIDDHSRLAYAEELPDESPATTAAFLQRAWHFYAAHGITIERILTDNGGCYRSVELAVACDELGIGHRFTRPYRPQTNGKAERMVRTLLGEWAYARPFADTAERVALLPRFIDFYNRERPHWSLAGQPPISRTPVNNLAGKNS